MIETAARYDLIDMHRAALLRERSTVLLCSDLEEVETRDRMLELEVRRHRLYWTDSDRSAPEGLNVLLISPGGCVYHAFALYDELRLLSSEGIQIIVTAYGMCASAAAMILLQAGDVRRATPSTSFLIHEIRRISAGEERASEAADELKEMQRLTDMCVKLLSRRCNKTESVVRKVFERKEIWMPAVEAKDWGLIDEIIEGGSVT